MALYFLAPSRIKNYILLLASLCFYAWGEPVYLLLMLASIIMNYCFGLLISKIPQKKLLLTIGIAANLSILVIFKYSNFLIENFNIITSSLFAYKLNTIDNLKLPLGVSFFTFQSISYIVDVYRRDADSQKNIFNMGLFITFFPKMIQGPIVRYQDIASQLDLRESTFENIYEGTNRFIIGLGKKVLIANSMGVLADSVFNLNTADMSFSLAWIGAYTLQIYYDFSGYSDMAIGLGRIFGFKIPENFNYPYISMSIKEFWRRWHITLSTWFRDYLYIPLGGNRVGSYRTYINLYIVFFATGLWHGSSWNFIVWGLFHGTFIFFERIFLDKLLEKSHLLIRHLYAILVFMTGWIFFRAQNLTVALDYLSVMFNPMKSSGQQLSNFLDIENVVIMVIAIIFSYPLFEKMKNMKLFEQNKLVYLKSFYLIFIFVLSVMYLTNSSYNPFIYFRF